MFSGIAKKIFGTVNERIVRSMQPIIDDVNALEPEITKLTDGALKGKTEFFRKRLKDGESLDDILPEAFAVVREASRRVLGMRHFDVQLVGGITLHRGKISEMKTGEGKTLVATLAVYLNALESKGVHVVTVNDYLASRDSEWMGKIYRFLGLSVGCIVHGLDDEERRAAYAADVTYGTNNEFGFDYLRDNMKYARTEMCQRKFNYAIVDEVDSILIDEARTPLIISGPAENSSELYYSVDKVVSMLAKTDYEIDEKSKSAVLTEEGAINVEKFLQQEGLLEKGANLYDLGSIVLVHHVNQALKAQKLFFRDTDYMIKDGEVMIIDEFTGRMMEGRRYSDGLHQALEAKEKVKVRNENQTLASITFQNYFRLYPKLAGMTGTAMTEASEFMDIYKLEVIEIPPNRSVSRTDEEDEIYRTAQEKYIAIVKEITQCHKIGQPILVGTISIEKSELLSDMLRQKKITHKVLNAKHHEKEAHIIAQAGRLGAVTIATNMAGRGTDIMLGGNPEMMLADELAKLGKATEDQIKNLKIKVTKKSEEDKKKVIAAGGLYVLGTERHESRRIDNQLRGRSGRQGDPGKSKFFISLGDDLMRIFGSDKISGMLQRLGLKDGESITHPWISRAIEKAQERVEQHNFEIRKNLLKFDDVMNEQRKVIYEQRLEFMDIEDVSKTLRDMRDDVAEALVNSCIPSKSFPEEWDVTALEKELFRVYGIHVPVSNWAKEEGIADPEILERIDKEIDKLFDGKEQKYGKDMVRYVEKRILLFTLDQLWKDHLLSLDHLRQGIGLRAYGQKDPLNEYKREAFQTFEAMLVGMKEVVTNRLSHMELNVQEQNKDTISKQFRATEPKKMLESRVDPALDLEARAPKLSTPRRKISPDRRHPTNPETWGKVSRNENCPCGSGKKFKQCHGKIGD